jgi:hypothetical protein
MAGKSLGHQLAENNALKARMDQADEQRRLKDAQNYTSKVTDEWLLNQANMWKEAVRDTELALLEADHYWDAIFSAKSKPSRFSEILNALVMTLVPLAAEYVIFAGVLKLATMSEAARVAKLAGAATKISGRKAARLARAKDALKHAQEEFRERTETLKEAGAHASVEGYKGVVEGSEKGEAQDQEESQGLAKLQFIEDTLEECRNTRHYIEACRHELAGAVDEVTPEEADAEHDYVVQQWTELVGLATPYKEGKNGTLKQIALILLYDMLRAYCKNNVSLYQPLPMDHKFPISTGRARAMAAAERAGLSQPRYEKGYLVHVSPREMHDAEKKALTLVEFEGLDPAQRKKMYEYVGQIKTFDPSRPIFKDWVELIKAWDFASD